MFDLKIILKINMKIIKIKIEINDKQWSYKILYQILYFLYLLTIVNLRLKNYYFLEILIILFLEHRISAVFLNL